MADFTQIATEHPGAPQARRPRRSRKIKASVRSDAPTIVVGDKTYVVVSGDVAVISIDDFAVVD